MKYIAVIKSPISASAGGCNPFRRIAKNMLYMIIGTDEILNMTSTEIALWLLDIMASITLPNLQTELLV